MAFEGCGSGPRDDKVSGLVHMLAVLVPADKVPTRFNMLASCLKEKAAIAVLC